MGLPAPPGIIHPTQVYLNHRVKIKSKNLILPRIEMRRDFGFIEEIFNWDCDSQKVMMENDN